MGQVIVTERLRLRAQLEEDLALVFAVHQSGGQSAEEVLNLYYRFTPAAWGRGYAVEAAAAALDWADLNRPERPLVVLTRPDNLPALAVARRLEFEHHRDVEHVGAPSVEYRRPRPGHTHRADPESTTTPSTVRYSQA